MKHIFLTILGVVIMSSCKAQIAPLYNADPHLPNGTYYKDLDNDLNKFVGTWLWQNGNDELTIIIEKKEQVADSDEAQFNDMLIGEYKYTENGTEVVDFLPRLSDPAIVGRDHYITFFTIMHKFHRPICELCDESERRVLLFFKDPDRSYIQSHITLRHVVDNNGQESLEAFLFVGDTWVQPYENAPAWIRIPEGEYTLVKQ